MLTLQAKRRDSNPFHLPSDVNQENNEFYMEQLHEEIDNGLTSMHEILSNLGSAKDTIENRRTFAMLQIELNQKLIKAANESIDLSLESKYRIQVQKKADSLRSVIERAIKEFAKYKPKVPKKHQNHHTYNHKMDTSEITPLLTNVASSSSPFMEPPYNSELDDVDEKTGNGEDGEVNEIQSIQSMQNVFDALYAVIREQELMVMSPPISNRVETMEDFRNLPLHIQSQRIQQRRDQRNMIIGLVLCLVTLAIIVTYIYFRFIYFKL